MPTVHIFGQEVERKHLLIGGGLIAAAIAVVVFLRARAASSAAQAAPQPSEQDQQGYGGGMSVAAPTGQIADQYQQQLQNSELEAQSIANKYQTNLVAQQEKQYEFQNKMQEQLAPDLLANEQANLAADTAYQKAKAKIPLACPPGYARARDMNGDLTCNRKGSGNIATDVYKGAREEAPQVGRDLMRAGERYVKQTYLPTVSSKKRKSTPPIAPDGMSNHGYEDHIGGKF
jgi:hypothetical protein